jgi:hypothetical protein
MQITADISGDAGAASRKTVFLHIGMGRCGSSAIQRFCEAKREELLRRGVCYPVAADLGFQPKGGNANSLRDTRMTDGRDPISAVVKYVIDHPCSTFLLSHEGLHNINAKRFKVLREQFSAHNINVKCIAYVREQREWLLSRYAQAVKSSKQWTISLEDYLRKSGKTNNLNYAAKFSKVARGVGPENLIVRIYQRDLLSEEDVRCDLFKILNVNVKDLIDDPPDTNASATVLEIELMRTINKMLPSEFNNRRLMDSAQAAQDRSGWKSSKDTFRLAPPTLLREIKSFYQKSNATFQRQFFTDRTGELFKTKIPDEYEPFQASDKINENSIAILLEYFNGKSASPGKKAKHRNRKNKALTSAAKGSQMIAAKWRQILGWIKPR